MRIITGVLVGVLAVSGCSSSSSDPRPGDGTAADASASSAEPSESESADPYAANLGEDALDVGQTRVGSSVQTTVHQVRVPYPPGEFNQPEAGNQFVGVRLTQCLKKGEEPVLSAGFFDFAVVTLRGSEYGNEGLTDVQWPAPRFPERVQMIPGRCVKGWIALQVPEKVKVDRLLWRPDGTPVAEWLLN